MRRIIISLFALLLTLPAHGQEVSPSYRLREPSAAEYFAQVAPVIDAAIPSNVDAWNVDGLDTLQEVMLSEIKWRGYEAELATIPAPTLLEVMYVLNGYYQWTGLQYSLWARTIVQNFLNAHSVDLEAVSEIDLAGWTTLKVSPRDFDGDGEPEYLLELFLWYSIYLVARVDGDGYVVTNVPIQTTPLINLEELAFEDFDGDTVPEWLIIRYDDVGPGRNGYCENVYLLTWRDGGLINAADNSPGYCTDYFVGEREIRIEDVNGDSMTDVIVHMRQRDNWECEIDDRASLVSREGGWQAINAEVLTPSFHCGARQAELAFASDDYEAAAQFYREALADPQPRNVQREQYAVARYAVALALSGDLESAVAVLQDAQLSGQFGELIVDLRQALREHQDVLQVCAAAYQFIARTNAATRFDEYPFPFWVGSTSVLVSDPLWDGPPSPQLAGCDLPAIVSERVNSVEMHVEDSTALLLADVGILVADTVSADYDGDGEEEQLVWTNWWLPPLYFDRVNERWQLVEDATLYYRLLAPALLDHAIVRPTGSDRDLIVTIKHFSPDLPLPFDLNRINEYCPVDDDNVIANVDVRRFDGIYWRTAGSGYLCGISSFEDVLPSQAAGNQIRVWGYQDNSLVPVTYSWNAAEQQYTLPDQATAENVQANAAQRALTNLGSSSYREPVEEFLVLLDHAIAEVGKVEVVSSLQMDALLYYRALTLEMMGRADDALAEYVALHTADSESAVGMLAGLHLEAIDP